MIYELKDPSRAEGLFAGWEEKLITSCLQGVMGKVFVTDREHPASAAAILGDFGFYAGEPDRELVLGKPEGFLIMTPGSPAWGDLIEGCYGPRARKVTRYAIKKNTTFCRERLIALAGRIPQGYEVRPMDGELYDRCLENRWSRDFVSVFSSREDYLQRGLGVAALKDGELVAGASSYCRYREGIEIEVGTREDHRRKGLATACSAGLILACLERGLYPSWDASNLWSVALAEKLGYTFSHEYPVYYVR